MSQRAKHYTLTVLGRALESGVGTYWPVNPARGIVLERHELEDGDEVVNAMDISQMRAYRRALGDDTLSILLLLLLLTERAPAKLLGCGRRISEAAPWRSAGP